MRSTIKIGEASDKPTISLAHLPPTSVQRRFAHIVVVLQFVVCAVVAPIPATAPRLDSFVPVVLALIFLADLITAVLLFIQSVTVASRAILILAQGYLFSALIVIPHALTFPGAFTPSGLLGAGVQSSAWLNVSWHLGFLFAVAGYACLKGERDTGNAVRTSPLAAFFCSLAIQISLVCALTWVVTAGDRFMPRLFLDDSSGAPLNQYVAGTLVSISSIVGLLMWVRRTSVLDLWIMVAICMLISEMTLVTFGLTARFYLGWYVSRSLAVAVSMVVLIALLAEFMRLHLAVMLTNRNLEREQNNRLLNVQAAISSIAHEVGQPLTGAATSAAAAGMWLARTPPDIGRARESVDHIERAVSQANEVLAGVRRLFRDSDEDMTQIDVNDLATEALQILSEHLKANSIKTDIKLTTELPPVMGHKSQLQEVILNVVNNAVDAMAPVNVNRRVLRLGTRLEGDKKIVIEIEDSGAGIEKHSLDKIFEPFVTTKPNGTGLGLAICSTIIERHHGRITASSEGKNPGALFQISLPAGGRLV